MDPIGWMGSRVTMEKRRPRQPIHDEIIPRWSNLCQQGCQRMLVSPLDRSRQIGKYLK
jgi:hypothetical protein